MPEEKAPEVLVEPEKQEEKAKAKLTNLKWLAATGQFNDKVSISVDAEIPEEYRNLTRIEFNLIALVPEDKREPIVKQEAHLKNGTATAEVTLYWPQYREGGELLEKCDYIFTAKHRQSEEVESGPLEVTAPAKWMGSVWVKLLSPKGVPIAGLDCTLKGASKSLPRKVADKDGLVQWTSVPLDEYKLEMKLGSMILNQVLPWLQDQEAPHIQRVRNLDQLLGPLSSVFGVQSRLEALGYDCGALDGIIGPKTKGAVQKFQTDRGLEADGIVSPEIQDLLKFSVGA